MSFSPLVGVRPTEVPLHQLLLTSIPPHCFQYLDKLFAVDKEAGRAHHTLQVRLYARHDRSRLLHFLKTSNFYALQVLYLPTSTPSRQVTSTHFRYCIYPLPLPHLRIWHIHFTEYIDIIKYSQPNSSK